MKISKENETTNINLQTDLSQGISTTNRENMELVQISEEDQRTNQQLENANIRQETVIAVPAQASGVSLNTENQTSRNHNRSIIDPRLSEGTELAIAMQISSEEQRIRQELENGRIRQETSFSIDVPASISEFQTSEIGENDTDLALAIKLSLETQRIEQMEYVRIKKETEVAIDIPASIFNVNAVNPENQPSEIDDLSTIAVEEESEFALGANLLENEQKNTK